MTHRLQPVKRNIAKNSSGLPGLPKAVQDLYLDWPKFFLEKSDKPIDQHKSSPPTVWGFREKRVAKQIRSNLSANKALTPVNVALFIVSNTRGQQWTRRRAGKAEADNTIEHTRNLNTKQNGRNAMLVMYQLETSTWDRMARDQPVLRWHRQWSDFIAIAVINRT
ncbi:hypothetical protein PoB_006598000 [Plakobranchus ocellatus]|uniref:Uncharacterized protein n=1 Tax=Plakobranchus ocellatus TaxID=259542 RepID=A0AAV4D5P8_9GAST|nr:hypothetical protein PoB_006598000 [Plakobranchus ocellatus]